MPKFNTPGDIHFITTKTFQDKPFFKDEKCCFLFLDNLNFYRDKYNLRIYDYCIMPNHIHLLISLDSDEYPDLTISKVMHGVKSYSAKLIYEHLTGRQGPRALPEYTARAQGPELPAQKKFKIWQPGFYDFNIYTPEKFYEKLEYIHENPVKASVIDDISKYVYCSWRNYELEDHSIFKIDYTEY